jgi:pyruvate-formate lyase-activating enzyme
VHDLAYLQRLQLTDHLNGMDHLMMEHLIRCVVEIVNLMRHQQDVEKMDVQQIPDEQNRDVVLTFLDAVHRFLVNLVNLADVQVVVEPRHLLKMDYYQDEVGVEPRHLLYL